MLGATVLVARWVHPCVCRGNSFALATCTAESGSSLRLQGQHRGGAGRHQGERFIPASAGATRPIVTVKRLSTVHPCVCRGNPPRGSVRKFKGGSSLRLQGQHRQRRRAVLLQGFIPASAGATPVWTAPWAVGRVHPCVCRGNNASCPRPVKSTGSSLRLQGQLPRVGRVDFGAGFIPASAGATTRNPVWTWSKKVHPCVCRGNVEVSSQEARELGSSLRLQGQPMARRRTDHGRGFIPASAGATPNARRRQRSGGVHPCVCRGNTVGRGYPGAATGSSLRLQGQRLLLGLDLLHVGFIPASAGATGNGNSPAPARRVHPCVCRGNSASGIGVGPVCGSSLRLQGQPSSQPLVFLMFFV